MTTVTSSSMTEFTPAQIRINQRIIFFTDDQLTDWAPIPNLSGVSNV